MKDEGVPVPKISDFGCSQLAERRYHRESQWGTEPFAAPESSGSQFTYMCDVYRCRCDTWICASIILKVESCVPQLWVHRV